MRRGVPFFFMMSWALFFLIVLIGAAVFPFGGVAEAAVSVAQFIFLISLMALAMLFMVASPRVNL